MLQCSLTNDTTHKLDQKCQKILEALKKSKLAFLPIISVRLWDEFLELLSFFTLLSPLNFLKWLNFPQVP